MMYHTGKVTQTRTSITPATGTTGRARTGHGGLRARIVAWFLIPAAAISIGVALLTFYAYRRVTEDLVLARNRDHTLLLANQLGTALAGYARPLVALDGAGRIELAALQESGYADLQLFDGGLLVLDPAGQIVDGARKRPEIVGQCALRGETGAICTLDRENQQVVAGFAPVPGTPWGLVTEQRWADLIQTSQPYTRFLLALLALGVLIPVIDGNVYRYHAAGDRVVLASDEPGALEYRPVEIPEAGLRFEVPAGWPVLHDQVCGFQLPYPQDWMTKDLAAQGAGVLEDWPVERVVIFSRP